MISEATRERIEGGLAHWHDPDSPERLRFEVAEVAMVLLHKQHRHITNAILASERLDAGDLQLIINTRA